MFFGRAAIVCTILLAAPAYAGPAEDAARKTFEDGLAEEARGSQAACEKFRKALELIREVGPLKKVKECDVRENKLRAARDKLRELIERWPVQDAELEGFKTELAEVEPRIPTLRVTASPDAPPDMTVRVDGTPVTLPVEGLELDPGEHEILVEAATIPLTRTPVVLAGGDRVELELPRDAPLTPVRPPVTPTPTGLTGLGIAGITVGSLGVAALIGGAITGGLVSAKKSDYDACVGSCTELQQEGDTLLLVNGVLFIAGAATTVLGGTLLVVDLVGSGGTDSALLLGPGRADWVVRF